MVASKRGCLTFGAPLHLRQVPALRGNVLHAQGTVPRTGMRFALPALSPCTGNRARTQEIIHEATTPLEPAWNVTSSVTRAGDFLQDLRRREFAHAIEMPERAFAFEARAARQIEFHYASAR